MNSYRVVGLMSGTSLDGVDLALCTFRHEKGGWKFKIEDAKTIPYSFREKGNLALMPVMSVQDFISDHAGYGKFLGGLVKKFLGNRSADFVASHGHTIFHQPSEHFTFQAGDGAALSAACGLPVVCDFRSVDIALGGQGAPLVPLGDKILFSEYDYCLNLGGIANISFEKKGKRVAFDICPVNIILNHLSLGKGKSFDKDGRIAMKGSVKKNLLSKLNSVSYYRRSFPKSLGREDIEKNFFPILNPNTEMTEDKLRTFCEHIAVQIGSVTGTGRMLVTGGGAYNSFLIERIRSCSNAEIVIPSKEIIEFKEALIFAFLGLRRWRNEINCLSSVTGALRDSSGGAVYYP